MVSEGERAGKRKEKVSGRERRRTRERALRRSA